jgi:NAD(P)-dependent dehydrogenase (short-subunit alcohol dehydrogenase family)
MKRTIVITGASDGIGAAAARELAKQGEEVVIVGRDPEKTAAVAADTGGEFLLADYTKLDDVRRLAAELAEGHPRIDVLMNNAGRVMGARELTADGFEKTFQVNHLAGFLLTAGLMDQLLAGEGTVINTSSNANSITGHIDLDDLQGERGYAAMKAYGNAKLANILHVEELHRRHHADGLNAVAVHPGRVATSFASETNHPLARLIYGTPLRRVFLTTPEKGAEPLIELATGRPGVDWHSGSYFHETKPGKPNKQAGDATLAGALWDRSAEMVNLPSHA